MKILLVEDDDSLIDLLTRSFSSQHYIVDAVQDGEMGWAYASSFEYDAIVLDIVLPKLDGIELCQRLRSEGYTTPILLLTAQDNITAKVRGLNAGADDYVVKPFDINELMARLRALLRRSRIDPLPLLSWGDLVLDPSICEVTYNGRPIVLTTKEYDLLELFLRDSYRVFSSEEIIDRLWSSDDCPAEATVRSHLRRLRRKLEAAGAPPDAISTIHGRGYHLKSPQIVGIAPVSQPADRSISSCHQQQYLAYLQELWVTTQPQLLERLAEIGAAFDRAIGGNWSDADRQQVHQQAHKLVGTLGVFTLVTAMEIARQIELALDRATLLLPTEARSLQLLLGQLKREIATNSPTQPESQIDDRRPLLLLVDLDLPLTDEIVVLAGDRDYRTVVLSTIAAVEVYLSALLPADALNPPVPTAILVGLRAERHAITDFLDRVDRQFSHRSVLVLSEDDELTDRLTIVRHGGKFLSRIGLTTLDIFAAAASLLSQTPDEPIRVTIVDDDLDWLRVMSQSLQPWGMKVTTLADPQQFWTVLTSIQPDALVLDLNMPELNGLELCQALRNDPHWHKLPILFLTASTDAMSQQSAFSAGADDYLCKPIPPDELARRIRHRLARFQTARVGA